MTELEFTQQRYRKIWLAYMWRVILGNILVLVLGEIISTLSVGLIDPLILSFLIVLPQIVGATIVIYITLWMALRKQYPEFRVVLTSTVVKV